MTVSCLQDGPSEGQDPGTGLSPETEGGHGARSLVTPGELEGRRGRATCAQPGAEAAAAPGRAIRVIHPTGETVLGDLGQN